MATSFKVLCAWCSEVMHGDPEGDTEGQELSHGVCARCCREHDLMDVEQLSSFAGSDLDALPFGVIEIDENGIVVSYNKAEAKLSGLDPARVIGRDFFNSVAPCANVKAFGGQYRELVKHGINARVQLDFVFAFDGGEIFVDIVMLFNKATRNTLILVNKTGDVSS